MDQQLIEKVMKQVSDELGIGKEECKAEAPKEECCGNIGLTEFVGTAIGDTDASSTSRRRRRSTAPRTAYTTARPRRRCSG